MNSLWSPRDKWVAGGFAAVMMIGGGLWRLQSGEAFRSVSAPLIFPAAVETAKGQHSPIPVIDMNRATAAEWEQLPGIGPLLARRIVRDRDQHGAFRSWEDVDRVRGIGPKLLGKIAPYLRISGQSEKK